MNMPYLYRNPTLKRLVRKKLWLIRANLTQCLDTFCTNMHNVFFWWKASLLWHVRSFTLEQVPAWSLIDWTEWSCSRYYSCLPRPLHGHVVTCVVATFLFAMSLGTPLRRLCASAKGSILVLQAPWSSEGERGPGRNPACVGLKD